MDLDGKRLAIQYVSRHNRQEQCLHAIRQALRDNNTSFFKTIEECIDKNIGSRPNDLMWQVELAILQQISKGEKTMAKDEKPKEHIVYNPAIHENPSAQTEEQELMDCSKCTHGSVHMQMSRSGTPERRLQCSLHRHPLGCTEFVANEE